MTEFMNLGLSHSGEFETQLLACPLALGSIRNGIPGALCVFLRRGKTVNLALGTKSNEGFPEADYFSSCVDLIVMYFGDASPFPKDQQQREKVGSMLIL